MDVLIDRWSSWMAASCTETLVLLVIVGAIDRLAEGRVRPALRHGLWGIVLVKLLLPPGTIAVSAAMVRESAPAALAEGARDAVSAASWLFWVWLAGALSIAAIWIGRGVAAASRLDRAANDADLDAAAIRVETIARALGVTCRAAVRVDPAAALPYVTGLLTPRLVLPGDWRRWTPATLTHAVGHELCHLRRRDLWWEAVWMAAAAAYWFHPLVHAARRRVHDVRELCCDADAAHRCGSAYRDSLLRLAGRVAIGETSLRGPQPRHSWGPVIARLKSLERWPAAVPRSRRLAGTLALTIAAAAVIPSWTPATIRRAAMDPAVLLDPVRRQEAGLGSMHVRYQLMQMSHSQGTDR